MVIENFNILNTRIDAVQIELVIEILEDYLSKKEKFYYLCSTNANNVINAVESAEYDDVMKNCDLSLPDSVPFLWYGRFLKYPLYKRCGIEEVMVKLFEQSNEGKNYGHFFYGNTTNVLTKLNLNLKRLYPNINIVGMYSPPFRELSDEEDMDIVNKINAANPDFLWVSLGCPKQEKWLYDHRNKLNPMIGGGSGAVFNFLAGETIRAPKIIQYLGIEWIYRLLTNLKKLWKRYLIKYPKFIILFIIELLKKN